MAPRELMAKDAISLIKLLPDELPCHLARLCRLSCRDVSPLHSDRARSNLVQVFAYRSQLFSSVLISGLIHHEIPSCDPAPPGRSWFSTSVLTSSPVLAQNFFQGIVNPLLRGWDSQRAISFLLVATTLTLLSGKLCDHEGPCHKPTRGVCHCYMRKVHCSRNCPCTKSCEPSS